MTIFETGYNIPDSEAALLGTKQEIETLVDNYIKKSVDNELRRITKAPNWAQGTYYANGEQVLYQAVVYNVIQNHTSEFAPDITPALYRPVPVREEGQAFPNWKQPIDQFDSYKTGDKVRHINDNWESLIDNNVWEPPTNWRSLSALPAWVQPTGAQDAYPLGAEVSHNGFNWRSTVDTNVWTPGIFGWIQI